MAKWILVSALVAIGLGAFYASTTAQQSVRPETITKSVLVQGKDLHYHLKNVRVQRMGSREFLVGDSQNSNYARQIYPPGTPIWVPLDTVVSVVEMDADGRQEVKTTTETKTEIKTETKKTDDKK